MKRAAILQTTALLMLLGTVVGCSAKVASVSLQQIRAMQAKSVAGVTSHWKLSSVNWARDTQSMRDRAYDFCIRKHHADATCPRMQDWSLIASNHAESLAADLINSTNPQTAIEIALSGNPSRWLEVRTECFKIYEDAGAKDTRMLGPCFMGALGGNYFGLAATP